MAIELHLHRVHEQNDPVEREIRSRLWWNLYILEKMLSGEQGPLPSTSESDEFELMTMSSGEESGQRRASMSVKLRTISALHTTISLSIIIEDLYKLIYGLAARKSIRENPVSGDRIRLDLWGRLMQWERDLPPSLTLDLEQLNSVPGVITNVVIMLCHVSSELC
ncbi:putative Uncharacterized transcriptional regulatory protein C3C7.04 [Glarea lozoyensis 74030]|uniref:Putative Uncharacterized transcriptional regulatory protein C3C7.04 n=1 Tax=Glarea lozoyensis (strain ATCC 74030 / MF5533) TaxID=1104152 RepID=H0EFZ1_GLAL7|nr:putative Uncharacterized transcriptional regulatory protein C3C7.04 [Glarea lozoyensis 74030]